MKRSMSIRCFAPEVEGELVTLSADETHHLSRVLRRGVGDSVTVFDGRGGEWHGTIADLSGGAAKVRLIERRETLAEPPVAVTLAVGLLKADAMSEVIRDATALGVATVAPFVSDHTALPAEALRRSNEERWRRVAIASAKQCARAVVPRIDPVIRLEQALTIETDLRILCVEPTLTDRRERPPLPLPPAHPRVVVFVGPEGGWSADEHQRAVDRGAHRLSLGPRTLRAEIAPAIVLAALWTAWGWE